MKFSPSIGSHSRCQIIQEYLGSWALIAAESNVAALERAFCSAWRLLAPRRGCLAVGPNKAPTCRASCSGTLPCVCTPICTIIWTPRTCLCRYDQFLTLGDRHAGALPALCSSAPSPLPAPGSIMAKHRCLSSPPSLCVSWFLTRLSDMARRRAQSSPFHSTPHLVLLGLAVPVGFLVLPYAWCVASCCCLCIIDMKTTSCALALRVLLSSSLTHRGGAHRWRVKRGA